MWRTLTCLVFLLLPAVAHAQGSEMVTTLQGPQMTLSPTAWPDVGTLTRPTGDAPGADIRNHAFPCVPEDRAARLPNLEGVAGRGGRRLVGAYRQVLGFRDAHWAVAAAARIAEVHLAVYDVRLLVPDPWSMDCPEELGHGGSSGLFRPHASRAADALGWCVRAARAQDLYTHWLRRCQALQTRLSGAEHPAPAETLMGGVATAPRVHALQSASSTSTGPADSSCVIE